jgi:hypothetical protein
MLWVDDVLDAEEGSITEKTAFLHRQKSWLEACCQGAVTYDLCAEEEILFDLLTPWPASPKI